MNAKWTEHPRDGVVLPGNGLQSSCYCQALVPGTSAAHAGATKVERAPLRSLERSQELSHVTHMQLDLLMGFWARSRLHHLFHGLSTVMDHTHMAGHAGFSALKTHEFIHETELSVSALLWFLVSIPACSNHLSVSFPFVAAAATWGSSKGNTMTGKGG